MCKVCDSNLLKQLADVFEGRMATCVRNGGPDLTVRILDDAFKVDGNDVTNYHTYANDRDWVKSIVKFTLEARATGVLGENELVNLILFLPHTSVRTLRRVCCIDDTADMERLQKLTGISIKGLRSDNGDPATDLQSSEYFYGPGVIVLNLSRIQQNEERRYVRSLPNDSKLTMSQAVNIRAKKALLEAVGEIMQYDMLLYKGWRPWSAFGGVDEESNMWRWVRATVEQFQKDQAKKNDEDD